MKKIKVLLIFVSFVLILSCTACGDRNVSSAKIIRDDARTGGSLSFVYDAHQKTVFVGGEEEIVQFSSADELKNLEEGCRIGIKIFAPDEVSDISNATLEMNGVNYASGDFLEQINQQKQRFFTIYPMFSKEDMEVKFSITWQDGTKSQEYKILVLDGTKFMQKDGTVS